MTPMVKSKQLLPCDLKILGVLWLLQYHRVDYLKRLKLIAKIQNDVGYKLQHAVRVIQSTHLGFLLYKHMSRAMLDKRHARNSGIWGRGSSNLVNGLQPSLVSALIGIVSLPNGVKDWFCWGFLTTKNYESWEDPPVAPLRNATPNKWGLRMPWGILENNDDYYPWSPYFPGGWHGGSLQHWWFRRGFWGLQKMRLPKIHGWFRNKPWNLT